MPTNFGGPWSGGQLIQATLANLVDTAVNNIENGLTIYTSGGTANAQTVTCSPALTSLNTGQLITFKVGSGLSNTGSVTLNVNGLGAETLQYQGAPLPSGFLVVGNIYLAIFDGTYWQIVGGATSASAGGVAYYASSTSGTNTVTATLSPAPASLAALTGAVCLVKITTTNTGAATIALNGLAATTITKQGGSAIVAGDLLAGQIAELWYDGTHFELSNPQATYLPLAGGTMTGTLTLGASTSFNGFLVHYSTGAGFSIGAGSGAAFTLNAATQLWSIVVGSPGLGEISGGSTGSAAPGLGFNGAVPSQPTLGAYTFPTTISSWTSTDIAQVQAVYNAIRTLGLCT